MRHGLIDESPFMAGRGRRVDGRRAGRPGAATRKSVRAREGQARAAGRRAGFRKAFARKKVQDVLYFASTSRTGVKQALARRLEAGQTPVWSYLFAYEYRSTAA